MVLEKYIPGTEKKEAGAALWLPTAYASLYGLARYGFYAQAHEAAKDFGLY